MSMDAGGVLQKIECDFSICKVENIKQIDLSREFVFMSKTPDEISVVCETDYIPPNAIAFESGWKALKVSGELDFSLIGIIAKIADILAKTEISIFVISTFNTDYILIKAENLDRSIHALECNGYSVK